MNKSFLHGNIRSSLVRFAIPLLFSLVLQALYGAVDLWVVGKYAGTESVAAVATGSQLMYMLTTVVVGLTVGVTVIISNAVGSNDDERAAKAVGGQIKLLTVVTIIIMAVALGLTDKIIDLMNSPAEAVDETIAYVRICAFGMIFISAYNGISGIFRGIGNSKSPFIFVAIACVCNIILDIIFVKYLGMKASGAAWATVIAQAVSVIFSIIYIYKVKLPFKLDKEIFTGNESSIAILKIGSPIAIQDCLTSISFLIITSIINDMGLDNAAGVGIVSKLFVFLSLASYAFMSALAAFVGQNMGAGQYERANKALFTAISVTLSVAVIMSYLAYFHGNSLARIFSSDEGAIAAAAAFMKSEAIEYIILAISLCFLGYFNGMQRTNFVMVQGLICTFVFRVPLSFLLSRQEGASIGDVALAAPLSAAVSLVLCVIYFFYIRKKYGFNK